MSSSRTQVPSILASKGKSGSEQCCGGLFYQAIPLRLHGTSSNVRNPRNIETYCLILSNNGINQSKRGFIRRKSQLFSCHVLTVISTKGIFTVEKYFAFLSKQGAPYFKIFYRSPSSWDSVNSPGSRTKSKFQFMRLIHLAL